LKIDKRNNLTNIYNKLYIEISKYGSHIYTGAAVDLWYWTRKHPLKDVLHCSSHMRTATRARQSNSSTLKASVWWTLVSHSMDVINVSFTLHHNMNNMNIYNLKQWKTLTLSWVLFAINLFVFINYYFALKIVFLQKEIFKKIVFYNV